MWLLVTKMSTSHEVTLFTNQPDSFGNLRWSNNIFNVLALNNIGILMRNKTLLW
jgi:hypothetical protein